MSHKQTEDRKFSKPTTYLVCDNNSCGSFWTGDEPNCPKGGDTCPICKRGTIKPSSSVK